MKKISVLAFISLLPVVCHAEYCEDQFYKDLAAANAELGQVELSMKQDSDKALAIQTAEANINQSEANILASTTMSAQQKVDAMSAYTKLRADAAAQRKAIQDGTPAKLKRISELRDSAPQTLKDKAKSCAEKYAPANMIVNLTIQGLATLYAPGITDALLANNPKALYVDMGEVLNGNVGGGPNSAPNVAKDWINGRLGTHF
ncbi:hypothetical protein BG58_33200 [Caballeronia jiangsuensis]|nr:hypothetical protein BG58_33200 [Caballeronia jiangsuensis]